MLGNQMFPAALGIFMVVLVQGLGFPPFLWGLLFFVPRLFDALTDPIMGFITDNTRSRWGRRRPYIFVGAILTGLAFIVMWQLYEENSLTFNFTYFLAVSLVFYLGLTIFATPYVAMGYEMSRDFHERTRLMAVAQWIGQWAWVIVPWFWPLIYDPDLFSSAAAGARSLGGLGRSLLHGPGPGPGALLPEHPDDRREEPSGAEPKERQGEPARLLRGVCPRLRKRALPKAVPGDLPGVQRIQHRRRLLLLHHRLPPVRRRHGRGGKLAGVVRHGHRPVHHLPGHPHRHVRLPEARKEEHVPDRPGGVRRRVRALLVVLPTGATRS